MSDDFSDLFAHVNLMLDIVFLFDVQSQVAEMERGFTFLKSVHFENSGSDDGWEKGSEFPNQIL